MNFTGLAFLDPFDLAGSLRQKMGLFKADDEGPHVCPVRWRGDGDKWVIRSKWPELTTYIQHIKQLGGQAAAVDFGVIYLEMLPAGSCADWIWPAGVADGSHEHAIVMLRTNPGFRLFAGDEVCGPAIGVITAVNRRVPRSAINMGETPAIWLALDYRQRPAEPE